MSATLPPPPSPEEIAQQWRFWHRRLSECMAARCRVGESAAAQEKVTLDERLVQAIWSDQMLRTDVLATASGKAVEVIEPGRWNTSRGPDFLDARIRLAGEIISGDIEIHTDSADWHRHGHHQDYEYNGVMLHVALRTHDDRPYEEKQNGERLERLVLEHFVEPDLETIRATINLSDYPYGRPAHLGLCHEEFLRLADEDLHDFFIAAGRARIEDKVARFAAQRNTAPFLQVLHQAVLTSLGFKSSKTLYFLLSKRAPVEELQDHAADLPPADHADFYLAAFLHVARLTPEQPDLLAEADGATQEFIARLEAMWRRVRPYFSDRLIPPTKRWYAGMRPAGFPTRRLSAAALLLERLTRREDNVYRALRDTIRNTDVAKLPPKLRAKLWKQLAQLISVEAPEHYFATHFTFGGKQGKPQALLGEPAARSLLFNVLLPMFVVEAREKKDRQLERRAWDALQLFPILEKNSVTRFMETRLFGETGQGKGLLVREVFQQALLKVFNDCCAQNERTCEDCTFLALAEKIGTGEG